MEFKDYYQIMGVKRDATQDEVKRAYRTNPPGADLDRAAARRVKCEDVFHQTGP